MSLRSRTIRLASFNAELRPHLLKVLAGDKGVMQAAIKDIKKAKNTDDLRDICDELDYSDGEASITDTYGDVAREVARLRRGQSTSGGALLKALQEAVKKTASKKAATARPLIEVARDEVNKIRNGIERLGFTQTSYEERQPGPRLNGSLDLMFKGPAGHLSVSWTVDRSLWDIELEKGKARLDFPSTRLLIEAIKGVQGATWTKDLNSQVDQVMRSVHLLKGSSVLGTFPDISPAIQKYEAGRIQVMDLLKVLTDAQKSLV